MKEGEESRNLLPCFCPCMSSDGCRQVNEAGDDIAKDPPGVISSSQGNNEQLEILQNVSCNLSKTQVLLDSINLGENDADTWAEEAQHHISDLEATTKTRVRQERG